MNNESISKQKVFKNTFKLESTFYKGQWRRYLILDRCGKYRLIYYLNGEYKIQEFLLAPVEWWELSGTATKKEYVNQYLKYIADEYGIEEEENARKRLEIKLLILEGE